MKRILHPTLLLTLLALLALSAPTLKAQTAAPAATSVAYRFMQFTVVQGPESYMSFAPEFAGQRIVKMPSQYVSASYSAKAREALRANDDLIMRELESLSTAGWELVQMSAQALGREQDRVRTTYLFRRLK